MKRNYCLDKEIKVVSEPRIRNKGGVETKDGKKKWCHKQDGV